MDYVQPLGGAAGAPYVDANPALAIEGSAVPAAAIEHPMREIMAVISAAGMAGSGADLTQLKQAIERMIDAQSGNYAIDTGVANAYVVALNPAIAAYSDGLTVRIKVVNANTGAATLNAGGGVVPLVNDVGGALVAGDLPAGGIVTATYILSENKFRITSLVQSQGDARYAALAGLATQLFSVAAATGAGHALALGQLTGNSGAPNYISIPFWDGTVKRNLIIQWAGTGNIVAGGNQVLTLPVAFPNALIRSALSNITAGASCWLSAQSTTQITISNNTGAATGGAQCIIVGY